MAIWHKTVSLEDLKRLGQGTMAEHIGIEITEIGEDFLRGTMPVDHRTVQPLQLLHGGASLVLAETLGSVAANLVVDPSLKYCVGLEINGNHVRSAKGGKVTGTASPLHLGSGTQVWSITITDENERLVCISRLTVAVLNRKDFR